MKPYEGVLAPALWR